MAESGPNRSLSRAAAILDAVEDAPRTVSEIARLTGVSISATHRLANDMLELGFLRRTPESKYYLGRRFNRSTAGEIARPYIEDCRDETGETTQLWIRQGDYRICVTSADSNQELRATLPELARLQLPEGSAGQLLAGTQDALVELGKHGWVESVSKRTPGLSSVSAPVVVDGKLLGAICIAIPMARIKVGPGAEYGDAAIRCAAAVGSALSGD
ncbi:IclR family transcriptional regulator [Gulosibacter molinativorax]|uniref:ArsR family transcriptional regulator n=1 Tax=Gulosibacter molinativorax TaxID=256821 RepID=A0ABT7CA36_9MICO|nr:helix-turn-helix domain-containing protein [Gulosibacter molinativorax]MDJ1372025.1 ArsR family transcriptional regulator [Gulosibacter molinativorax]QUY60731.1 ArsR family transcriptional regulator [Gulosibacter molinativorax]